MTDLDRTDTSVQASGATADGLGKESAADSETRSATVDVGWDAFFATFEDSDVDLLHQERTSDGSVSRFHTFVRAGD